MDADKVFALKRWTLRILLCLILLTGGAITTVAVAWGFQMAYAPSTTKASGDLLPAEDLDSVWRAHGIGGEYRRKLGGWRSERLGATIINAGNAYLVGSDGSLVGISMGGASTFILLVESGLPVRSFSYARTDTMIPGGLASLSGSTNEHLDWLNHCHPMWFGFLIDTLSYAAIWGGVFFGFTSAKRFIRIKRGRCPRCGYDLRGGRVEPPATSPGCPECGWGR